SKLFHRKQFPSLSFSAPHHPFLLAICTLHAQYCNGLPLQDPPPASSPPAHLPATPPHFASLRGAGSAPLRSHPVRSGSRATSPDDRRAPGTPNFRPACNAPNLLSGIAALQAPGYTGVE